MLTKTEQTAKVEVYLACTCATCESGARWFMCPTIVQRFVTAYMCDPKFVDCGVVPCEEQVKWIGAQHPGCSLIYAD